MSGMIKLGMNLNNLEKGLISYASKLSKGLGMYSETTALQLEGYAKQKAPWTDRTGKARERLKASVKKESDFKYEITLAHGVDYGVWLELANEKKYAIISPTLKYYGPLIMKGLKLLVGGG